MKSPISNMTSKDNLICRTCKSPIDDSTSRFLVVKDRVLQKHKLLSFHYFFPCWDIDYVLQNLSEYEIFKVGFFCDKTLLNNPKAIDNMRQNHDLWDIAVNV